MYPSPLLVSETSDAAAAMVFMLAAHAEGLGTCPMEGFDESRVKRLLRLPLDGMCMWCASFCIGQPGFAP